MRADSRRGGNRVFPKQRVGGADVANFEAVETRLGRDRERAAGLRAGGDVVGGPAPFAKADRSRFLQALDEALVRLAKG